MCVRHRIPNVAKSAKEKPHAMLPTQIVEYLASQGDSVFVGVVIILIHMHDFTNPPPKAALTSSVTIL